MKRWTDSQRLYSTAVLLLVQSLFTLAASSIAEYSNTNELSQLIRSLEKMKLNKDRSQQRLDGNDNILSYMLKYPTTELNSETDETWGSYVQIDHSKNKRGWEEIQRSWRSHFPKRAWEVVRNYWRSPTFRSAFKSYIGKRSEEELVEVPIQPENQNDIWTIDELDYDSDASIDPELVTNSDDIESGEEYVSQNIAEEKRGWEEIPVFRFNRFGKRSWEDVQLTQTHPFSRRGWEEIPFYSLNRLGKRGWEDIRLFSNSRFGKRGSGSVRVVPNEQIDKRGWEDIRLFPRYSFGKRERDHLVIYPRYRHKRGWEEIPQIYSNRLGKRGWEDVQLLPSWRFAQRHSLKRGWEDVGYFNRGRLGKRGVEVVPLMLKQDV